MTPQQIETTPVTTDAIAALMADGRWRTSEEIARKLGAADGVVRTRLGEMRSAGLAEYERIRRSNVTTWRATTGQSAASAEPDETPLERMRRDAMEANVRLGLAAVPRIRPGDRVGRDGPIMPLCASAVLARLRECGPMDANAAAKAAGASLSATRNALAYLQHHGFAKIGKRIREGNRGNTVAIWEAVHAARAAAEREHGYHPNHGRPE